jgi:hypothetical protein
MFLVELDIGLVSGEKSLAMMVGDMMEECIRR